MVRISTTYDKIFDEIEGRVLSKKVFVVRGDEAYARTTEVGLTLGTINTTDPNWFTTNIKVDVYRGVGSSVCYLYDEDDLIGQFNTTSNVKSKTFSNLQFKYDEEHTIKAVYKGNAQCLGSNSRVEKMNVELPPEHKTNIDFTSDIQYPSTSYTYSIKLTVGESKTVTDTCKERDILIYVDGQYYTTLTTDNNGVATYASTLALGTHNIRADVERDTGISSATNNIDISNGYIVEITDYPTIFIIGRNNQVIVSVRDNYNNPVVGKTVSFNNVTATTNNDGIATLNVTNITDGKYHAICQGNNSNDIDVVTPDVSSMSITSDRPYIWYNNGCTVTVQLNGSSTSQIPVTINDGKTSTVYTTDNTGKIDVYVNGESSNNKTITATYQDISESLTIDDYIRVLTTEYTGSNVSTNVQYLTTYAKYFQFATPERFNPSNGITLMLYPYLQPSKNYQLEMDIIEFKGNLVYFNQSEQSIISDTELGTGKLRWVIEGNISKFYMDDVLVKTTPNYQYYGITGRDKSSNEKFVLKFNNVKIKEI